MPTIKFSELQINQSIEGEASDSSLVISVDPTAGGMKPGTYVFQLEVIDDAGNRSAPATAKITVIDDDAPTAIISGPETVSFGKGFTFSGAKSTDIGGSITKYIWTQLQ